MNSSGFYGSESASYSGGSFAPPSIHNVYPYSQAPRIEGIHGDNSHVIASKLDSLLDEVKRQREENVLFRKDMEEIKEDIAVFKRSFTSSSKSPSTSVRRTIPTDLRVSHLVICRSGNELFTE